MFKTFIAELKYIFKTKWWRALEWVLVISIPLVYGFLYMNAYWDPFGNTQDLRVAVVNLDSGSKGNDLATQISTTDELTAGSDMYEINIEYLDHPEGITTVDDVKNLVNEDQYHAVIIIPENYSTMVGEIQQDIIDGIAQPGIDLPTTITTITNNISATIHSYNEESLVTFYNSFKHSYLAGEMTNFGSGLSKLMIDSMFPQSQVTSQVLDAISQFFVNTVNLDILDVQNIGSNIDTYGLGMSPYFISIALWAGALAMTFLIKNDRHIKNVSTMRHYFGKTLMWVMTGWIQASLLLIAVTLQGVNVGADQWMLVLFTYFISMIFSLTVQGIAFSFRYGDLGEFAAVVLLVLQLVSSGGTYPVGVQNPIFQWLHPVIPFTYTIDGLRETLYDPQWQEIMKDVGILLIFPTLAISTSLTINYFFDKKTKKKGLEGWNYKSFEIHMDDM